MKIPKDPTPETLANRRAGTEMVREAALRGNDIAGMLASLEALALSTPYGHAVMNAVDHADDDDGWDDIRPY